MQEAIAQITWYHNIALLEKLDAPQTRLWYVKKTVENGWSRNILVFQIESRLHERLGKTVNNFAVALPPADSDMARQIFKDPYVYDFLGTADPRREADLEQKLIDHLQQFLLELGLGFAFVGRQVHLEIGDDDFYLDLLRHPDDKPSIGLLLVKEKNQMVVEYALAGYTKPIGVADLERQITRSLPDELKSSLPSIEEIEAELGGNK